MVNEYQIRVIPQVAASEEDICKFISNEFGLDMHAITAIQVVRRSIDARQRTIYVNLKVRVYINENPDQLPYTKIIYPNVYDGKQVIVVGEGPGGLFAALRLIEMGLRPIVIERGKNVHERKKDIAKISRLQKVDAESNYCFGEGGAGAYSDGKLYTRSKKRGNVNKILGVLCQHGAPTAIMVDVHPHIGTDKLPNVIENMRETILKSGGEVHHQTRMERLLISSKNIVEGIEAIDLRTGKYSKFYGPVILATGHSARDVYRYLYNAKIAIEPKGIAVGVRLEHPANLIDRIQYHNRNGRGKYLPAAEYSFVTQVRNRGVYSFCMCPGGFVIPAATGDGQIVVNGMSPSNRGGQWSNSGMVVETRVEDIEGGDNPLKMMLWQEKLEHDCWIQGNMHQSAPAQRMLDFVNGTLSYDLPNSSYSPGLISSPLHFWLPCNIADRLRDGFKEFGRKSHGFLTNEAVMIAVETRTSSPVRIVRDQRTLMHVGVRGLFPCGEGAGYAGGIVSAGIDGERCAEMCAEYLSVDNNKIIH